MEIKNQNNLREKIINKLLGLIYRLDNSGNSFLDQNGEENFINQFISQAKVEAPVIFDVGANVGNYSQLLVKKLKGAKYAIHLFEPQRSCFNELQQRFYKNEQVNINNFGLSDSEGESLIYKNEDKSGLASLYKRNLDFYDTKMNIEERIELKRADQYIQSNDITHIDLLKIDVEGHELATMSGFGEYLNPDFIDFIQFEYGGANLDSHVNLLDFYNLLLPFGFKVAKIMPKYLEMRDYKPRADNFVYSNYVAISGRLLKEIH